MEKAKQMAGRNIRVSKEMMEDAKKLVKMMGCAVVEAPCEDEAKAAKLCQMNLCFGTATEDMDALTFGTTYQLRGFNSKKEPICQIELAEVLKGFEMNMEEFIDLCILCGCDYTHTIGGLGQAGAFKFVTEHKTIENVLDEVAKMNEAALDKEKNAKYRVPDNFLYNESRNLFKNPEVIDDEAVLKKMIVFGPPEEEKLKEWLMNEKSFNETKIVNGIERLKKSQHKKNQTRLDCFFKAGAIVSSKKSEDPKAKKSGARGKSVKGKK